MLGFAAVAMGGVTWSISMEVFDEKNLILAIPGLSEQDALGTLSFSLWGILFFGLFCAVIIRANRAGESIHGSLRGFLLFLAVCSAVYFAVGLALLGVAEGGFPWIVPWVVLWLTPCWFALSWLVRRCNAERTVCPKPGRLLLAFVLSSAFLLPIWLAGAYAAEVLDGYTAEGLSIGLLCGLAAFHLAAIPLLLPRLDLPPPVPKERPRASSD